MLPGYVSHQTPCGVAHYKPSKDDLRRARGQARSFRYNRELRARELHIDALFVMGSAGTVGQSESSDLDIWVCYNSNLSADALAQLRLKRSEEHTSELQSRGHLVCRLLLEKKKYRGYRIYF